MTPAQARASLARSLDAGGEIVVLQRLAGAGAGSYSVRARMMGGAASDLVGSVQQQKRKAIVSAEDVQSAGFPLPFLPKQDRLLWSGKTLTIVAIDDATRRLQGELIGYEFELSGA